MKKYEELVPQDIREELTKGARSESDFNWLIADRALSIYQRCMVKQIDVTESDIWTAIAHYCRKPAIRVKQIAVIGGVYSLELRAMITEKYGYWEFGYFLGQLYQMHPFSRRDLPKAYLWHLWEGEIYLIDMLFQERTNSLLFLGNGY